MAIITWKNAVSGNWSDAADWSNDTVPTSTDEAEFLATGNYTVTVTSAETANALLFEAPGAELVESAAGALALNEFILYEGSVELDGTNTIGLTEINGGVVTLGAAGALGGGGALEISGGELIATVSETLTNPLSMSGGFTIAAAPGTTLNLDGSAAWSLSGGATVNFGAPGVTGVVVWHTPSGSSIGTGVTVNVRGGVLRAGDGRFLEPARKTYGERWRDDRSCRVLDLDGRAARRRDGHHQQRFTDAVAHRRRFLGNDRRGAVPDRGRRRRAPRRQHLYRRHHHRCGQ